MFTAGRVCTSEKTVIRKAAGEQYSCGFPLLVEQDHTLWYRNTHCEHARYLATLWKISSMRLTELSQENLRICSSPRVLSLVRRVASSSTRCNALWISNTFSGFTSTAAFPTTSGS